MKAIAKWKDSDQIISRRSSFILNHPRWGRDGWTVGPDCLGSNLDPSPNSCGNAGQASYLFCAYFLTEGYMGTRHAVV